MDIRQLRYFITIVDHNCNLLNASKKLYISQPALSQMIKSFEKNENVVLFERSCGKLQGLSSCGQIFYSDAVQIVKRHDTMMGQLRANSTKLKGNIKIGIPPLILSVVFSEVMSKLILGNPEVHIEIVELGAYELKKSLLLQKIDIAILLDPTKVSSGIIEEAILAENELCAFVDKNNPLASENRISWSQLHQQPMAIFNESFMIRHQLIEQFKAQKIKPNITLTSGNWDFLLRSVIDTNLITILPAPVFDCFPSDKITRMQFHQPIGWQILMCRNKKTYSRIENYIFKEILDHFDRGLQARCIRKSKQVI